MLNNAVLNKAVYEISVRFESLVVKSLKFTVNFDTALTLPMNNSSNLVSTTVNYSRKMFMKSSPAVEFLSALADVRME